jgi:hypothetical protein
MNDDRKGGAALIAGTLLMIVTMSLHPTGHDLFRPGQLEHFASLGVIAHAIAITSLPLSFLGALALTGRLTAPGRISVMALVVFGFALVAGMAAAAVSGFVAPALAREMAGVPAESAAAWTALFQYNGAVNQAFAKLLVAGSSLAIFLWSLAIVRGGALGRGIGFYGVMAAAVILFALLSGHLPLSVHGFGLVVLAQAVWFVVVGVQMMRSPANGAAR